MTAVVVQRLIQIPASVAWDKLSSFSGIEKFSPIEHSVINGSGEGCTRICYLPDRGGKIYEELTKVDNASMVMQYIITGGDLPVEDYVSTIKVESISDKNCKITWGCEFKETGEGEDSIEEMLEEVFLATLIGLEENVNALV